MDDVKLHDTMDAGVWAKEFMRLQRKFGWSADEDMMRGWFANAIMCGWDHRGWRETDKLRALAGELVELISEIIQACPIDAMQDALRVKSRPILAKAKEAGIDAGGKNG